MQTVIGVRFRNAGKLYYFNPGNLAMSAGNAVIVETSRGIEYAEVIVGPHQVQAVSLAQPLRRVVRVATQEDAAQHEANRQKEIDAHSICAQRITAHKLDMKLVSVEYTFDNNKLIAYFTANGRVDFRALVKDLAAIFRTRIELKQIGVRDEAKMLGGLGPCGRPICCAQFLGDFHPVSIKMAKEQNLSLNPTKISGICGRLMCCLKYEQEAYEKARKNMPKVGKDITTPDGPGTVSELNILKETIKVKLVKGDSFEYKEYPVAEIQQPTQPVHHKGKADEKKSEEKPSSSKRKARSHRAELITGEDDEEFIETDDDMFLDISELVEE